MKSARSGIPGLTRRAILDAKKNSKTLSELALEYRTTRRTIEDEITRIFPGNRGQSIIGQFLAKERAAAADRCCHRQHECGRATNKPEPVTRQTNRLVPAYIR